MDRLKGNPTALLLYSLILMHYNKSKGCAWPSQDRLAELMCVNTRTVQRNLTVLENKQVIKVVRGWDGFKRSVNQYRLVGTIGSPDLEDMNVPHMEDTNVLLTRLSLTRSKEQQLTSETDAPKNLVKNTKSPSSSSSKSLPKTNTQIATEDEAFMEFWSIYPRKVGKAAAHKAWKLSLIHI